MNNSNNNNNNCETLNSNSLIETRNTRIWGPKSLDSIKATREADYRSAWINSATCCFDSRGSKEKIMEKHKQSVDIRDGDVPKDHAMDSTRLSQQHNNNSYFYCTCMTETTICTVTFILWHKCLLWPAACHSQNFGSNFLKIEFSISTFGPKSIGFRVW